jgi:thiol-disulfide isomerase/thioredoxin
MLLASVVSVMNPRLELRAGLRPAARALALPLLVYTAALGLASPAAAQTLDAGARAEVEALRAGDMRKLVVHAAPAALEPVAYLGPDGAETTLAASDGRLRVVNFWATWCAPCREEMPALEALQEAFGGPDFEVLLIATGRNSPEAIARFFEEAGIDRLETGLDPKSALARAAQAPGLPVTLILNREGQEIARLTGGADWGGESARAIVAALLAM